MSRAKGSTLSLEHREKIAKSLIGKNKGRLCSISFKEACRDRRLGLTLSEDTKRKIGEGNKGVEELNKYKIR